MKGIAKRKRLTNCQFDRSFNKRLSNIGERMPNRREFLTAVGATAVCGISAKLQPGKHLGTSSVKHSKAYGSGYFGEWIEDQFGLPAYEYTCDQVIDSKAITPVYTAWRLPTDQTHQVGNDRL